MQKGSGQVLVDLALILDLLESPSGTTIKYIALLSAAHAYQAQLNRVGRQRRAEPSLDNQFFHPS